MLVRSAWTGHPAPAHYARTGSDTCPASLAPIASLASLAIKVLLNATRIYQSLWTMSKSVTYSPTPFEVGKPKTRQNTNNTVV